MKYLAIILMGLLIWASCESNEKIESDAGLFEQLPPLIDTFPDWEPVEVPIDSNAGPQEPPLIDPETGDTIPKPWE